MNPAQQGVNPPIRHSGAREARNRNPDTGLLDSGFARSATKLTSSILRGTRAPE
jgi:hypothetical protein